MTMTVTTDKTTEPTDEVAESTEAEAKAEENTAENTEEAIDTVTEGQAADVDTGDDGRPTRSWRRRFVIGMVVFIFIAALALSSVLGWKFWEQRQITQAGQQAQAAAVAYAEILTSIDSNKVDENFNQVLDGATGEFKDMYSQSSTQLRQLLIDNKATAHGVVLESAIQSESKNKVVVLLFVDQSVSNTNVPDPRMDRSRIKMTMEFVDGRWRASQVALP
jgi:Mce-associated membrane protein